MTALSESASQRDIRGRSTNKNRRRSLDNANRDVHYRSLRDSRQELRGAFNHAAGLLLLILESTFCGNTAAGIHLGDNNHQMTLIRMRTYDSLQDSRKTCAVKLIVQQDCYYYS